MFWFDEEREKKQYIIEWIYEGKDEVFENCEIVRAYSEDDAEERFWELQDSKSRIPDEAEVVSIILA